MISLRFLLPVSMHTSELETETTEFQRYSLFDIWLNALTRADIVHLLCTNIELNRKFILANQNLHSVYLCTQDAKMREFFDHADYTHIDGTSLILLGRLSGLPFRLRHRNGYMDLFPSLIPTMIEKKWRVFHLGSKPEILKKGLARLRQRYPGLLIEGHHGYFSKVQGNPENEEALRMITEFKPDILLVGMGMPVQERWILENLPRLDAKAIMHCGGMMDFIAGAIPTPPRWLGRLGLEWAFRLLSEPNRLWRRYSVEPVQLLIALLTRKRPGSV